MRNLLTLIETFPWLSGVIGSVLLGTLIDGVWKMVRPHALSDDEKRKREREREEERARKRRARDLEKPGRAREDKEWRKEQSDAYKRRLAVAGDTPEAANPYSVPEFDNEQANETISLTSSLDITTIRMGVPEDVIRGKTAKKNRIVPGEVLSYDGQTETLVNGAYEGTTPIYAVAVEEGAPGREVRVRKDHTRGTRKEKRKRGQYEPEPPPDEFVFDWTSLGRIDCCSRAMKLDHYIPGWKCGRCGKTVTVEERLNG